MPEESSVEVVEDWALEYLPCLDGDEEVDHAIICLAWSGILLNVSGGMSGTYDSSTCDFEDHIVTCDEGGPHAVSCSHECWVVNENRD